MKQWSTRLNGVAKQYGSAGGVATCAGPFCLGAGKLAAASVSEANALASPVTATEPNSFSATVRLVPNGLSLSVCGTLALITEPVNRPPIPSLSGLTMDIMETAVMTGAGLLQSLFTVGPHVVRYACIFSGAMVGNYFTNVALTVVVTVPTNWTARFDPAIWSTPNAGFGFGLSGRYHLLQPSATVFARRNATDTSDVLINEQTMPTTIRITLPTMTHGENSGKKPIFLPVAVNSPRRSWFVSKGAIIKSSYHLPGFGPFSLVFGVRPILLNNLGERRTTRLSYHFLSILPSGRWVGFVRY